SERLMAAPLSRNQYSEHVVASRVHRCSCSSLPEHDDSHFESVFQPVQFVQHDRLGSPLIEASRTSSYQGKRNGLETLLIGNLEGVANGITDRPFRGAPEQ